MSCVLQHKVFNSLQQCTYKQLKQIHAFIITTSLGQFPDIRLKFLRRSTEYGEMEYPNRIFAQMGGLLNTDMTLWNAMIRGYAYNGPSGNCLSLFDEMIWRDLKPNNFTYPYVLSSCTQMGLFSAGQKVHCRIIKSGFESAFSVGNALFYFYVKKFEYLEVGLVKDESLIDARRIFDEMCEKPVELWNKMIAKYASIGDVKSARELFEEMPARDVVSWNTMISVYAKAGDVANARDLFERMPEKNVVSWTSMLGAYAAVGDIGMAQKFFNKMPEKNVVSWNSMMSIYTQKGEFQQALDLFVQMQLEDVQPDSFTFVAALSACSNLSNLESGKRIHYLIRDWPRMGVIVGTALVEMYANCGDIDKSFTTFIKIGNKDVFCYNVMIKSLAVHGRAEDAIKIFHLMQKRGLKPNDHTYSCAIFACSHGGLVEEGREIFEAVKTHLNINPKLEHYCSMIDLLCRNDQLEEAESLIKDMQVEPDIAIWGALLGGCRERANLKLAESIISKAIELRSEESGVHVLLSNIHASMGQWSDALRARKLMEENKIWKKTGTSSII
ncbi:UNVERIFIED_CONTAM: Pentatricopeptide repeat-containing protein [Sesamum latifolium]|uniref:Pentatricopeptide repeat-containing protein n=1 Tax=Sesamum latifolium TaxID=2727402 RepID=A0AAW2TAS6_9LAMI